MSKPTNFFTSQGIMAKAPLERAAANDNSEITTALRRMPQCGASLMNGERPNICD
jgi:hypothetical protein